MTALRRPVWLLDIDGVLNAATKKPDGSVWPAEQWVHGHAEGGGNRWPILFARPVADFILETHDKGRAEIRWHTTWQHDAGRVGKLLGLPDFPVHDAPEFRTLSTTWWKLPGALRVVEAEQRPLVWTDDDAANSWDLPPADRARLHDGAPTLIVAPSPNTGLTPKHLRQIDDFLDPHAGDRNG